MYFLRRGQPSLGFILNNILLAVISAQQIFAQVSSSSNPLGHFIYPVDHHDNPRAVFNFLDILNASWSVNWAAPWLHLWCTTNETVSSQTQIHLYGQTVPPVASRLIALDYGNAYNRCHFQITPGANAGGGVPSVHSPNFNIIKDPSSPPVTWSSSSTTTPTNKNDNNKTSTSTPIPSPPTVAVAIPATSTPDLSSTSQTPQATTKPAETGLSSGAKVGICISGGALGLALIGGVVYLTWRRRRQQQQLLTGGNNIRDVNETKSWYGGTKTSTSLSEFESPAGSKGLSELGPSFVPHELDSGPMRKLDSGPMGQLDSGPVGELEGGKGGGHR